LKNFEICFVKRKKGFMGLFVRKVNNVPIQVNSAVRKMYANVMSMVIMIRKIIDAVR